MTTTTAGSVLIDDDAAVRTITLNRPEKRNAIDIEYAQRLAAGPQRVYGVIKALLANPGTIDPLELLEREAICQSELFDTDDFAEGIAAFGEKRRPIFGDRQRGQP